MGSYSAHGGTDPSLHIKSYGANGCTTTTCGHPTRTNRCINATALYASGLPIPGDADVVVSALHGNANHASGNNVVETTGKTGNPNSGTTGIIGGATESTTGTNG
jgi:hypothetical protein